LGFSGNGRSFSRRHPSKRKHFSFSHLGPAPIERCYELRSNWMLGWKTVGGHGFAFEGEANFYARSGADVWVPEHVQIDETRTGRPGSGCRPLLALHLARDHRTADLPASRLTCGSQYSASPAPERQKSPLLVPLPCGESPSVMFPRFGPVGGLAMFSD